MARRSVKQSKPTPKYKKEDPRPTDIVHPGWRAYELALMFRAYKQVELAEMKSRPKKDTSKPPKISCIVCKSSLNNNLHDIDRHVESHLPKKLQAWECPYCKDHTTSQQANLLNHIRTAHTFEKKLCGALLEGATGNGPTLACGFCHTDDGAISRHLREIHERSPRGQEKKKLCRITNCRTPNTHFVPYTKQKGHIWGAAGPLDLGKPPKMPILNRKIITLASISLPATPLPEELQYLWEHIHDAPARVASPPPLASSSSAPARRVASPPPLASSSSAPVRDTSSPMASPAWTAYSPSPVASPSPSSLEYFPPSPQYPLSSCRSTLSPAHFATSFLRSPLPPSPMYPVSSCRSTLSPAWSLPPLLTPASTTSTWSPSSNSLPVTPAVTLPSFREAFPEFVVDHDAPATGLGLTGAFLAPAPTACLPELILRPACWDEQDMLTDEDEDDYL